MQLKTILNLVQHYPGFVFFAFELTGIVAKKLEVSIREREGSKGICSRCKARGPCYDHLEERRFEFVPLWGIPVFFLYAMRRIDCLVCGRPTVEEVPWATGKSSLTKTYAYFLATWAKRMSWKETAEAFHTSWESVFRSVQMVVAWGLEHRNLDGIKSIGVDEVLWLKGKFLTVVYQIDAGRIRLLWLGKDRKEKTLLAFFREFGRARSAALEFVCSDMWKPYLNVIARKASQALHILDRFHIMANMNKGIDEVRRQEVKDLKAKGLGEVLKGARWTLLKRPENRTPKQDIKFADLISYNLRSVRAHLMREDFQQFWDHLSSLMAGLFLDRWCARVMRSNLEPMKKSARSLLAHRPLILNWFKACRQVSMGATEGMNNKLKVITRRAFGFRTYAAVEVALYHALGDLPDPAAQFAHRFC
jgi:transposase